MLLEFTNDSLLPVLTFSKAVSETIQQSDRWQHYGPVLSILIHFLLISCSVYQCPSVLKFSESISHSKAGVLSYSLPIVGLRADPGV